jgi:hypothetical protein
MTHQKYNEPVDVLASFTKRSAVPHAIKWGRRRYNVEKVNLVHVANEGRSKIFYFSVSDKLNFFKLRFDAGNLEWRLLELYSE